MGLREIFKPLNKCCCCFELRIGIFVYSCCIILWGFIQFVIAASALGYTGTERYKNDPTITSVPMYGTRGFLAVALIANLYSIAVGIVGLICTGSVERIKSYNRRTLALTVHFFRMIVCDFILQEVLDVVGTAAASDARSYLKRQGKHVPGSEGAFHFGQALNFLIGFFVHAYLVYCVYSYKRKLLDQSRGIFEGDPVLDMQKFEASGLQMTYTTPPVAINMTSNPINGGYGAPAFGQPVQYGTTNAPGGFAGPGQTFNNPAFASGFGAPPPSFGAPPPGNGFGAPPPPGYGNPNPDGPPPPGYPGANKL